MDHLMTAEDIEREIQVTMRERGIDYGEAQIVVGMKYGELHGDILYMRPLSEKQRRRHQRTLREVMVELGELDDAQEADGVVASTKPGSHRHRAAR
jgi:hypothetical protein